jgi:hypothetical protein
MLCAESFRGASRVQADQQVGPARLWESSTPKLGAQWGHEPGRGVWSSEFPPFKAAGRRHSTRTALTAEPNFSSWAEVPIRIFHDWHAKRSVQESRIALEESYT